MKRQPLHVRSLNGWLYAGAVLFFAAALASLVLTASAPFIKVNNVTLDVIWKSEGDVWVILSAIGTIGATIVAVWLGVRGIKRDQDAVARVVSAWTTESYTPSKDEKRYERSVLVRIANQSNEPVFGARANVVINADQIPLGPLSLPTPISVVPPNRELEFDISIPLLAHPHSWNPRVMLYFTDPRGRRWHRSPDGDLTDVSNSKSTWVSDEEPLNSAGDLSSPLNPLGVVIGFLAAMRANDLETVNQLVSPIVTKTGPLDWKQIEAKLELSRYQPTSMVDYLAPRVARIKLSGNPELEGQTVQGEGLELTDYMFVTVTFNTRTGWRIYGVGTALRPDEVELEPEGWPAPTQGSY